MQINDIIIIFAKQNSEDRPSHLYNYKEMSRTKILVCCHKPDKFKQDDVYFPIQVGKAISKYDLKIQGDDTGDNISNENQNFCELTGLYWAWKNMKPVDYIGLCHYRRYFNFHGKETPFSGYTICPSRDFDKLDLSIPDMDSVFNRHDIVLSKPEYYPYSLGIDYARAHVSDDLRTLFKIVNNISPEYNDAMNAVFNNSNKLPHYNMMIMRWNDFTDYCQWLFAVLFEARKRINIENYNSFQARIWGYMSERLLPVYVYHKNMRPKYYPIYWINDQQELSTLPRRIETHLRRELCFLIMRSYH